MRDQNIQYNGQAVIPYYLSIAEGSDDSIDNLAQQFGAVPEDGGGNYVDLKLTPEYLEALQFFNLCYNEKLMPDEVFTANSQQREQRVANGEVFASTGWMNVRTPREALYVADNNALMLYCGHMTGESGKRPYVPATSTIGSYANMITSNAKNPERIITLFAYCSQEEFTLDCKYGTGCYDIVDGAVKMKPEKQAEFNADYNAASAKYMWSFNAFQSWSAVQRYWPKEAGTPIEEDGEHVTNRDPAATIYDTRCFTDIQPETGSDMAVKASKIDDYWVSALPKMVMAATPDECQRIYEQELAAIRTMGFDELCEYYNARFQENKAKTGEKFAHPANQ